MVVIYLHASKGSLGDLNSEVEKDTFNMSSMIYTCSSYIKKPGKIDS